MQILNQITRSRTLVFEFSAEKFFSPAPFALYCRLKCLAACQCSRLVCCDAGKRRDEASFEAVGESWSSCWSWAGESVELFNMCKK